MAYEDHTMGKGKARVTAKNEEAHKVLEKDDWGHAPFKMMGFTYPGSSPITKKNKEGKEQGADGRACWDDYKFVGTEDGKDKCVPM